MKHIRVFKTKKEYDEAEKIVPSVTLISETRELIYDIVPEFNLDFNNDFNS